MRQTIVFIFSVIALLWQQAVQAETYPSKPIRIVVPYLPGGSPDVLARVVAHKISESTGWQIVVENRPGAGGVVAANVVMNSAPDGYTLLIADSSVYSIAPSLNPNASVDALKSLMPVTLAATSPIFLVVNPGLNVSNVKELIALAKSKPGLPYGSSGIGTAHHLAMELLKSLAGIDMNHIPYKGASQTVPAVIAGEVGVAFAGLNQASPQAKAGKLTILAVATGRRTPLMPELATVAESGVPGFDISITLGFFAPLKTPPDIVAKLNAELVKAVKSADVQQRLVALGVESVGASPEQFTEVIRNEIQQYGKLVKTTGARVD
ncbi:MAG: tripartite tricarboxylate transporter substrate binding protein [Burkholderiales bacterium]|nr:tripartite tricarboxylate transporter substrate binding protein [Burkholderiales bacterium]